MANVAAERSESNVFLISSVATKLRLAQGTSTCSDPNNYKNVMDLDVMDLEKKAQFRDAFRVNLVLTVHNKTSACGGFVNSYETF